MENKHKHRVVAWWMSGQTGIAKSIAGYSKFEYSDLAAEAEGTVSKTDTGYCFSRGRNSF